MHILDLNKDISAKRIVLVNNAPNSDLENLLSISSLEKVKIIKGDFFNEAVLARAAPERAIKILILADATPNQSGQIPTMTEADARTIMTAMTLNKIAKGVHVVAEILDSSMAQYLTIAQVHDIIYSREYSRMLVGVASSGMGLTNVLHGLIDPNEKNALKTIEIPSEFVNKKYSELSEYYRDADGVTLIGLLENSGNAHNAKEIALKKAQQTPNVEELVQNLYNVKEMQFNQPIFNPSKNYVLKDSSMAIVISKHAPGAL